MSFLSLPKMGDPAWQVRRSIAVYCLWAILLVIVWILGLVTYAMIAGKPLPTLGGYSAILTICLPSMAGVVAKYINDASRVEPVRGPAK